jgi:hypothetical protein
MLGHARRRAIAGGAGVDRHLVAVRHEDLPRSAAPLARARSSVLVGARPKEEMRTFSAFTQKSSRRRPCGDGGKRTGSSRAFVWYLDDLPSPWGCRETVVRSSQCSNDPGAREPKRRKG